MAELSSMHRVFVVHHPLLLSLRLFFLNRVLLDTAVLHDQQDILVLITKCENAFGTFAIFYFFFWVFMLLYLS